MTVSSGVATFTDLTLSGTVGEDYVLRFTASGLTSADSTNVTVTAGAAAKYLVTASTSSPTAGGTTTISAQLADANDNAVSTAGEVVTWSTTFTGGSFASATSTTDASGVATVVFTTPTTVASGTVTATSGTAPNTITGTSASITSVAGTAAKYLVTASTSSPTAGGTTTISAQLADANDNAVSTSGEVVTWSTTFTGGSFASATSTTDASGTATVVFTTPTTVASGTVTATTGSVTGTTSSITSVPGAASTATSTVSASPTTLDADGSSTSALTVQLKDANGNDLTASGGTVTFVSLASGEGSIGTVTDNTDGTYSATYTAGTTPGMVTITAELGGNAIGNTASITLDATVPGAPTALSATAGNGSAEIAFTPPANTGGSAITNYEYTIDSGTNWTPFTPAATTSPVTVTGLSNGTPYSIALRAVNSNGAGTASSPVSVTPATVPDMPTIDSATPGNGSAEIAFTGPVDDGGSLILDYEYELDASGTWVSFGSTSSPATITGLTNGQTYSVSIRAVNAMGAGAGSTAADVTPATVPDAPTALSATPDDQSISVAFTAPADDGGAVIVDYEYELDGSGTWTSAGTAASPVAISGLVNGQSYSVKLRAVNSMGEGAASSAVSATPTPCGTFALGFSEARIAAAGGESAVMLEASGTCSWTAVSSEAWLTLDGSSGSGSGSAELLFSVAANATNNERTATITVSGGFVGDVVLTVTQTRTGQTNAWGLPKYGLGTVPAGETTTAFVGASANRRNNAAIRANGTVLVWGLDTDGQNTPPAELADPATADVVEVAMGQRHVLARQSDGDVFAWGRNGNGQCDVPSGLTAISIAAGRAHSLAVRSDGTVAAWGRNQVGQCDVPAGLTGVVAVTAGDWHSVALKSDGTVVAWGDDTWGQATVPSGLTGVSMISAGRNHTLALKSDGTVVAWGDDRQGQSTVRSVLQNPATANVVQISGGRTQSVALQANGTIVYWGTTPNGSGTTPSGLTGSFSIAAGDDATLALAPPSVAPPMVAGGSLGGAGAAGATLLVPESFESIGDAVAEAGEGSVILVGPGVYRERIDLGDRGLSLVAIGAPGEVVLDGTGLAGAVVTIGPAAGGSTSGLTTRLDGFTIVGGVAEMGGGVRVDRAVAEIVGCTIRDNVAVLGGGIAVSMSDLLLERTAIAGNIAEVHGGGVHAIGSSLMLSEVSIAGNIAGEAGGGLWVDLDSMVLADGLVLCENLPEEAAFGDGEMPPVEPAACPAMGDLNQDGAVDAADLGVLMGSWGTCGGCVADLDGDGEVDGADLALLMTQWMEVPRGG
ncbi:MAG: invasin domain 3-containing protein [Planctomycetota bacterium]